MCVTTFVSRSRPGRLRREWGLELCKGFPHKNCSCQLYLLLYTNAVRVGLMVKSLLLASAIPLIGGGCGGLAATPAFSPLMLLMPGLGQNDKTTPPSTNQ